MQLTAGENANQHTDSGDGFPDGRCRRRATWWMRPTPNRQIHPIRSKPQLPSQGRDFSNLVNLGSGIQAGTTTSGDMGTGTNISYGVKVSFNGLPPTSFKFTVDGTDTKQGSSTSHLVCTELKT